MSFGPFIRFLFCGIETERNTPGVAVPAGRVEMVSLAAIVVVAFVLRAALPTFLPTSTTPTNCFSISNKVIASPSAMGSYPGNTVRAPGPGCCRGYLGA